MALDGGKSKGMPLNISVRALLLCYNSVEGNKTEQVQ